MTTQSSGAAGGQVPRDTWGTRLLIARTQRGLTQQEAADACGLTRATWSTWEDGVIPRSQAKVTQKIAEGLGWDVGWLMFGGPLAGDNGPDPDWPGGGLPAGSPTLPYADRRNPRSPLRTLASALMFTRLDAA